MAEKTVIVAGIAAGGIRALALFAEKGTGDHMVRPIAGTFLLVGVLLLAATWWPEGAAGLAAVVLVTSIVLNGQKVFGLLKTVVK